MFKRMACGRLGRQFPGQRQAAGGEPIGFHDCVDDPHALGLCRPRWRGRRARSPWPATRTSPGPAGSFPTGWAGQTSISLMMSRAPGTARRISQKKRGHETAAGGDAVDRRHQGLGKMQEAEEVFLPPPLPIMRPSLVSSSTLSLRSWPEQNPRSPAPVIITAPTASSSFASPRAPTMARRSSPLKGVQLPRAVEGEDPHRTLVRDHEGGRHGARPIRAPLIISCLSMKLSKAAETQRMSHRGFQSLCHKSAPCNSHLRRCDLVGLRHEQEQGIGERTFMDKQVLFKGNT